ncbi:MAG TPA: HAD family hydrolase, partial [Candidatus Bathyarchaeota archaeon]|nr:HAD family hydrolase [Candidatus Bathyarchaeota archaeon]
GALEVLGYLKSRGIKIGIITNGCRNYAMSIAKKFSLDKYVGAIVARDEVSDPKPNPKHLRVMLKILGVSAEETIFVGDHWIDASCARDAAVKFVLLKSGDKRWRFRAVNCMKFVIIEDLRDLLNLL